MSHDIIREIVLERHRTGVREPASAHLAVREATRPALGDGQVRVRNTHLGLAAVYADLMDPSVPLPMPSFEVGERLWGSAVGTVVESRADALPEGTVVQHTEGFGEETVTDAAFGVPEGVFPARSASSTRASPPTTESSTSPGSARATWCASPARPAASARSLGRSRSCAARRR